MHVPVCARLCAVALVAAVAVSLPSVAHASADAASQALTEAEAAHEEASTALEGVEQLSARLQARRELFASRERADVVELDAAIDAALDALTAARAHHDEQATRLDAARRAYDGTRLRESWSAGQPGSASMSWPAEGPVSSAFGTRTHPITGARRLHAGIDIPGDTGALILAAAPGTVVSSAARSGYGLTIVLDHGNGVTTLYAHASVLEVAVGDQVTVGQRIGQIGSTGLSTAPHLHFEVRLNDQPVDPMTHF